MALLAVFFGAALLKIWRRDFGFFRVLLAAGVSGWLLLNLLRVDAVVAEYNVEAYLTGNISALDVAYLAGLSDEALPSLARLPADMSVYEYEEGNTVGRLLEGGELAHMESGVMEGGPERLKKAVQFL